MPNWVVKICDAVLDRLPTALAAFRALTDTSCVINNNEFQRNVFRKIRPGEEAAGFDRPRLSSVHVSRHAARQGLAFHAVRRRKNPPQGNMSFTDGAAVCDAACAGYGLAQLQDYFIDAAVARGKLISVPDRFKPN